MKLILLLFLCVNVHAREIHLYFGQSNSSGRIPVTEALTSNENIYGWDSEQSIWVHNPHHEQGVFHPQVAFGYPAFIKGFVGCEMTCSRMIAKQLHEPVYVIKFAWGGSPISMWHPDSGPYYNKLLGMCRAVNVNSSDNVTAFWMQGESDCSPPLSKIYLENLKRLESRIKKEMFVDRLIVGRITVEPWVTYTGSKESVVAVRTALEQFEWVDTDAFPKVQEANDNGNPPAHYSAEGTRMLGRAFALQYLYTGVPRYRLYNPKNGQHYLTLSGTERRSMEREGWVLEDKQYAYRLPAESPLTTPLYRSYNSVSKECFWTPDLNEYQSIRSFGWTPDGIDGHIFKTHVEGSTPLYRFHSPYTFLHHWTHNGGERLNLLKAGWVEEPLAGYVIP